MKKRIVAAFLAMILAVTLCGSVLAEEIIQDDVVIEEISADEAVDLTGDEADTVESEIMEIESEDNFVVAVEEVETKNYDATAEYEIALTEVIILELDVAGEAASAAPPYISLYSNTVYSGSYGAQLSEESKAIYDAMVTAYVDNGEMDGPTITLKNEFNMSIDNAATDAEILADSNFKEALENLKYLMQPAYDAFVYDYPEVAWLGAVSYTPEILVTKTADGICTAARIPTVTLIPKEKYTGAKDDCSAFAEAVGTVVEALNCAESMTTVEKIEVIHDYLCEKIEYEKTAYAHTAAGVFVRDGKVVCEGYAKAFKILCNKFDIECVLIPGYANGAHMWNYVKMDDGNWYLVDVTWDDETPIDYTYFLAGSDTVRRTLYTNFSGSQYTQNFVLPFLSNQKYEAEIHLHTWEIISETAPTCKATGSRTYQCTDENCGASVTETLGKDAHKWLMLEAVSNGDATCTADGTKTVTCSVCGGKGTMKDKGSMLSHSFTNYVPNNDAENCLDTGTKTAKCDNCDATDTIDDPDTVGDHVWETEKTVDKQSTCTASGSKSIHCSLCNVSKEGTEETVAAKGHSFTNYIYNNDGACKANGTKTAKCDNCTVTSTIEAAGTQLSHSYSYVANNDATVFADGTKTASCSYGCGTISTVTDAGTKLTPTWKLNASKITLKVGQSTTRVKVTGIAAGDSVKSWSSSNSKIVTAKNGKITAKKVGTAYVYVRLASDTSSATPKIKIKVTVQKTAVKTTKIAGLSRTMTIDKGKKETLSPVLYPTTSVEKITYTSSNKKVAVVSNKGVITAKAAGKSKITVKAGTKKFTITVTVPKTKTTEIKNVPEKRNLNLKKKKTYQLKAKCVPANTDQKLTYSSSKPSIVKVSTTGKLTAKKVGTAVITVKSGSIKVKCRVTVK